MIVYYRNDSRFTKAILERGFRDDTNGRAAFVTSEPLKAVRGGRGDSILAVELPSTEVELEAFEETHPAATWRMWCLPASILNAGTVERVPLPHRDELEDDEPDEEDDDE